MKSLKQMKSLRELDCSGNPVTERRVYMDYVRGQLPLLQTLDAAELPPAPSAADPKQGGRAEDGPHPGEKAQRLSNSNSSSSLSTASGGIQVGRAKNGFRTTSGAVQVANAQVSAARRYLDVQEK